MMRQQAGRTGLEPLHAVRRNQTEACAMPRGIPMGSETMAQSDRLAWPMAVAGIASLSAVLWVGVIGAVRLVVG